MNVIQRARAQARHECTGSQQARRDVRVGDRKPPPLHEVELRWLAEHPTGGGARPYQLTYGDKRPLTPEEIKLFAHTPYRHGFLVYEYEGSARFLRESSTAGADDPRRYVREGRGVVRYPHGERYEGQWRRGVQHGEGRYSTTKNYTYAGEWCDGAPHGRGAEQFLCGSRAEGNYDGGSPSGAAGVISFSPLGDYYYEGDLLQGLMHGSGALHYSNGDVVVGGWQYGRRHGRAVTVRKGPDGRESQYVTHWSDGELVGDPSCLDAGRRVRAPPSHRRTDASALRPADLTKWSVKEDVCELPFEHFIRIKKGFEQLDDNRSGSLSTAELSSIWGSGTLSMLKKLDTDGNGTVELDEIFAAWYPNVPSHNVHRFMQQNIPPHVLWRLRGVLGGVANDAATAGYATVVGATAEAMDRDAPTLSVANLEAAQFRIGGERFPLSMYDAAQTVLGGPPTFEGVLDTWYPNVPPSTLTRYAATEVPAEELAAIREGFASLATDGVDIDVSTIEAAQRAYQTARSKGEPIPTMPRGMEDGLFAWEPMWRLGSIHVTLSLLRAVDKFDANVEGSVSLPQLLRFCYPNVPCRRMRELLLDKSGRKTAVGMSCSCQLCSAM